MTISKGPRMRAIKVDGVMGPPLLDGSALAAPRNLRPNGKEGKASLDLFPGGLGGPNQAQPMDCCGTRPTGLSLRHHSAVLRL